MLSAGSLSQVEEEEEEEEAVASCLAGHLCESDGSAESKQARAPLNLCLGCIDGSREDRSGDS